MSGHARIQRALLLREQGRNEQAEQELRGYLIEEPGDGGAHALLSLTLVAQERWDEAEEAAKTAIGQDPELAFAHYALAAVLYERNRYDEAESAIVEALRLDPAQPHYYSTLAAIELDRKRWPEALAAAEEGLKFDPEDVACNNLRAIALVRLGRKEDAGFTIDRTLAREPDNSVSHANKAWTLLEQGQRKEAMEHFRESLRLDPNNAWARAGLVEALKAGNPVYALMLRYFLWVGKLSERAGWGVILAAYFGYRLLRGLADSNPQWAPFITPVLVLYIAFALLTWLAQPLFNLVLFLHPIGRHALEAGQRKQAILVGSSLAAGAACATVALTVQPEPDFIWFAIFFGLLSIPLSAIHKCAAGWPRNTMAALTAGLAAVGLAGLSVLEFIRPPDDTGLYALGILGFVAFFFGILISQFVANWLMQRVPRR